MLIPALTSDSFRKLSFESFFRAAYSLRALLTVVIVPNQNEQVFGSLFQISSAADEIFISGATVDDVVIIDAIGANQLAASGTVVTSTTGTTTSNRSTSAASQSTTGSSGSSTGSSGSGY